MTPEKFAEAMNKHGWFDFTNRCICGYRPIGGDMNLHIATEELMPLWYAEVRA